MKHLKYFESYKVCNNILISNKIEDLPKNTLIVKHFYKDKIKTGELGIFACALDKDASDFGKNIAYISIGKNAKMITIHSSDKFLSDRNLLNIKSSYLKNKYQNRELWGYPYNSTNKKIPIINTLMDLFKHSSNLKLPDQIFYETQRETVNILKKENGNFDVLEMKYEDDISPHQYLIINANQKDIKI